jgi:hypothetical protein
VNNRILKIALEHLRDKKADAVSTLVNILKDVKSKKIKNETQFYIALENSGLSKREFEKAVIDIIDSKNLENLLFLGFFLGEGSKGSGLDILKKTWWERNISDFDLKKTVPSKFWELFRDKNWINNNSYAS